MMQNVSNEPQAPSENVNERGYAPQQMEYQEGMGPQSGYQQMPYTPGQPYTSYYQGQQQQYWNQQPPVQWAPGDVSPFERTSMGMKARTAGLLSYLFGWVGGLVFLLLERDNRFVRFHAIQSILFFGTVSILSGILGYFPYAFFGLGGVVGLVGFIGWIVLMVAAHRGRYYKLPLFGDFADRLTNRAGQ
jgi:uncharacterized membrane protein